MELAALFVQIAPTARAAGGRCLPRRDDAGRRDASARNPVTVSLSMERSNSPARRVCRTRCALIYPIERSTHGSDQFPAIEWFLHETCCFGDGSPGGGVAGDDNHLDTLGVKLLDQIVRRLLLEVDVHERNSRTLLGN